MKYKGAAVHLSKKGALVPSGDKEPLLMDMDSLVALQIWKPFSSSYGSLLTTCHEDMDILLTEEGRRKN